MTFSYVPGSSSRFEKIQNHVFQVPGVRTGQSTGTDYSRVQLVQFSPSFRYEEGLYSEYSVSSSDDDEDV